MPVSTLLCVYTGQREKRHYFLLVYRIRGSPSRILGGTGAPSQLPLSSRCWWHFDIERSESQSGRPVCFHPRRSEDIHAGQSITIPFSLVLS
jgi:hypothetical protein